MPAEIIVYKKSKAKPKVRKPRAKAKRGRPPKPKADRLGAIVAFRLTSKERDRFEVARNAAGLSRAAFVMNLIQGKQTSAPEPTTLPWHRQKPDEIIDAVFEAIPRFSVNNNSEAGHA